MDVATGAVREVVGAVTLFASAPGGGTDDIYGLAFAPSGSAYGPGLHVTGDTDGAGVAASRPPGGGYAGDGTVTPISAAGAAGVPHVAGLGGVHAVSSDGQVRFVADRAANRVVCVEPVATP